MVVTPSVVGPGLASEGDAGPGLASCPDTGPGTVRAGADACGGVCAPTCCKGMDVVANRAEIVRIDGMWRVRVIALGYAMADERYRNKSAIERLYVCCV
jgi:hypothetical protein